jgi:Transposase DDE domain
VSARLRLLHAWLQQVEAVLPAARVTRVRGLALFAAGMIWAGTVRLHQVAAALPLGVRVPSTERRLRRLLANPAITVETLWRPLLPILLRRWAGQEVVLVFDPTPHRADWTVLWLGIVLHRRVLPLAWCLVPQQRSWPQTLEPLVAPMLAAITAALPTGCRVTLLGDRGVAGPTLIDAAQAQGWDVVLRLNVGPSQAHRLRVLDPNDAPSGVEWRLWDWVETVGPGWQGAVQIFQGAGWRTGYLTVHRRPGMSEWWILFSTRPGGRQRIREYARRSRVEATFGDAKRRGWGLEQSRVTDPGHLDRLLLVWHLALWWLHALGVHVIKRGMRPLFDRPDRRERSLVRLGWLWHRYELDRGRCPPLLFRLTAAGWQVRGTP